MEIVKLGQGQDVFLAGLLGATAGGIVLAGLLGGLKQTTSMPLIISGGIAALCAGITAWLVWRQSRFTWIAAGVLFLSLGLLRGYGAMHMPAADISHRARTEVSVRGTVLEEPAVTQDETGVWHIRYTIAVDSVVQPRDKKSGQTAPQPASGHMYIYAQAQTAEKAQAASAVQIGDRMKANGKVRSPHGYQNPGQINTKMLLRSQGITASLATGKRGPTIEARDDDEVSLADRMQRRIVRIRQHYRDSMTAVMPKEDAAAIFAMLFGGYGGIKPELLEAFTTTGIVHILSVSGSHISLLAAVVAWFGTMLRWPRMIQAAGVIVAISVYSVLAGCVPPVIRSALMGGLTFVALALDREKDARRILLLTGLVMLLVSPLLLYNISFQLSFLATAGLLYLAPGMRRWMLVHHWGEWLAGGLSITLAAQASTLPVLAWYFNQLSLSSLLANVVVVPIVEFIIVVGLLAGVVAFLLPFIGRLIFAFDDLLLGLVFELTKVIAGLPGAMLYFPSLSLGWSVLYYMVLAIPFLPAEYRERLCKGLHRHRRPATVLALAAMVAVLGWRLARPAELTVHFIDVGQGDCALVITPGGHAFLFDTGGTRTGFDVGTRIDVPYLLHYGVRRVDAIFLSHCHEDHAAGAGGILARLPVGHVYTASEGLAAYARSMKLGDASPYLRKFSEAHQGEKLTVDGVTIEVVFAPEVQGDGGTGNEASNVYRVSYGQASFLFTGDLVKEQEAQLLAEGHDVASTVLKAGHHGSDTSSSPAFIAAVHPKYVVYCVGADNGFGHPKPAIVDRFAAAGVKSCRTDEDGAVVFHTDGKKLRVERYADE